MTTYKARAKIVSVSIVFGTRMINDADIIKDDSYSLNNANSPSFLFRAQKLIVDKSHTWQW